MMTFIYNLVPWWVWVALGVATVFAAWRFLGTRGAIAAAGAVGAFLLYKQGRTTGYAERKREDDTALNTAVAAKKGIDDETAGMSLPDLDRDNSRWLRDRQNNG